MVKLSARVGGESVRASCAGKVGVGGLQLGRMRRGGERVGKKTIRIVFLYRKGLRVGGYQEMIG
jgi:hypothetical protein